MTRLAGCIDRGLDIARDALQQVGHYAKDLQAVDDTLKPNDTITGQERETQFLLLWQQWESSADPVQQHFAKLMGSFEPGLFVGGEAADFPMDNLALERWFKLTFRTLFRTFAAIFEEPPVEGGSGAIARRSHAP